MWRKEEKALTRVQRKQSKLARGTPERRKHRKVVARVHERIKFRRDNFTHQHSRQIVDRFGVIAVEDLQILNMLRNHALAKSISDAGWSQFLAITQCKAENAGRVFERVRPNYTSQTCSACGHRQPMPLAQRLFVCAKCSHTLSRDVNAARNIGLGKPRMSAPAADTLRASRNRYAKRLMPSA